MCRLLKEGKTGVDGRRSEGERRVGGAKKTRPLGKRDIRTEEVGAVDASKLRTTPKTN